MVKHLLKTTALILCASASALAQPTLTAAGLNPVMGEVHKINNCNYVSPGAAGTNQTWNLSTLTASSSPNYTVGTVASTPYAADFSASSNIQANDGTNYSYWNNSSTVMAMTGIATGAILIPNNNAQDMLHFPFNMNNSFTDTHAASYTLAGMAYTRSGTVSIVYDGYGALTTPAGTFTDVARIHMTDDYSDVSTFGSFHYYNDQYIWYKNGYHQALASVFTLTSSIASTQGGSYLTTTTVTNSISEFGQSYNIFSYPNPAADRISFSSKNEDPIQTVELIDLNGKQVYYELCTSNATVVTVNLVPFSNGIYLAKIITQSGITENKKISIQK